MAGDGKEECVRCGDVDTDRRTLWMACFYQMQELKVPFEQRSQTGTTQRFYTLRVCKDCRADWMDMIEHWFKTPQPRPRPGTGIFIRRNGANIEVTEDEWAKFRAEQEAKAP